MDLETYLREEGVTRVGSVQEWQRFEREALGPRAGELDILPYETDLNAAVRGYYTLCSEEGAGSMYLACLYDLILEELPFIRSYVKRASKVLDAGCGEGIKTAYYAREYPGVSFVGIDRLPCVIERARERAQGLENLSFEAKSIQDILLPCAFLRSSFDLVLATNVLHETNSLDAWGGWSHDFEAGLVPLASALDEGGLLVFSLHFDNEYYKDNIFECGGLGYAIAQANLVLCEEHDIVFDKCGEEKLNTIFVCGRR